MKHSPSVIAAVILLLFSVSCSAQEKAKPAQSWSLGTLLPVNPNVKIGKLDNGITYYIMKNAKPEKRAELRLAVNAGSILEADDQQGLAHFCEHMAFNGTTHFKKDQLVKYLESIGTRFGNDLNAGTSFDETVYMLQIPTDKEEILNQGFQVLEDWAHNVTFDDDEIDKERGVILEEMRLGTGAGQRIRDKQFPVIFKGSKYAERLPIGKEDILKHFKHETLKKFYHDWYRPELMAVVAVGDFDPAAIEKKIVEHFSRVPKPDHPVARPATPVPGNAQTLYTIATDPEATGASIRILVKHDPLKEKKVVDYRRTMIENLATTMLNERLDELRQQSNPPFIGAYSYYGNYVRAKDMYTIGAQVENNGVARGLETILTEGYRVRKHGFTETELERAKTNLLRRWEEMYNERDKTNSDNFAEEDVRNFLEEEPIPGIEAEYSLHKKYTPSVTLAEVNKLAAEWFTDENMVVALSMPEKKGVAVPTEKDLADVFAAVKKKTIEPYVDKVSDKPLVVVPPNGATIAGEKKDADLGTTEWSLSNGIRVVLKPTDFKNDEILFGAISPGGNSLTDAKNYLSGSMAAGIIDESGLGDFDAIQLRKALTGKVVNVSPFISDQQEGLSGSAAPKDLETMFQLIYMYFRETRKDTTAFNSNMSRMKAMLENYGAMPEAVFSDTVRTTLAQYHPLRKPLTVKRLEEVDLDALYKVYRDRFSDASDFTFLFVGSFDPEKIKPMVLQYLGALPAIHRKEKGKDLGDRMPDYKLEKVVKKGIAQKSMVLLFMNGPFEWTLENRYDLSSLAEILKIKLREEIREEKGGTYGVGANASANRYPRSEYRVVIQFGCNPERVDELVKTTFDVLKKIVETGASEEDVKKVQEIQRREREKNLKENEFWLGRLQSALSNEDDPREILRYNQLVDGLTAETIRKTAAKYLTLDNYQKFVLLPEEKK